MSPSSGVRQRRAYFIQLVATFFMAATVSVGRSMQKRPDTLVSIFDVPPAATSFLGTLSSSHLSQQQAPDGAPGPAKVAAALSSKSLLKALATKVDTQAKGNEILTHLTAIARNYRMSVELTQKVGEPVDSIYRDQSVTNAKLVSSYAFQAASADAKLAIAYSVFPSAEEGKKSQTEFQRMQGALTSVTEKIENLKADRTMLEAQRARATGPDLEAVGTQLVETQAALEFDLSMEDALSRIAGMSDTGNPSGFEGEIEGLRQTAPGMTDLEDKVVPAPMAVLDLARSSGITSQSRSPMSPMRSWSARRSCGRYGPS